MSVYSGKGRCLHWNANTSKYSPDGCTTEQSVSAKYVTCKCTHLTSFVVENILATNCAGCPAGKSQTAPASTAPITSSSSTPAPATSTQSPSTTSAIAITTSQMASSSTSAIATTTTEMASSSTFAIATTTSLSTPSPTTTTTSGKSKDFFSNVCVCWLAGCLNKQNLTTCTACDGMSNDL